MDKIVVTLAEQLQLRLKQIDPASDRTTYRCAHGFLAALLKDVEKLIPSLPSNQRIFSKSDRNEVERKAKELLAELERLDDTDSLERLERELGGPEPDAPAGAPVKRKPGPKGVSDGVALPLPDQEPPPG
jgi:hypothetical protein